MGIKDEKLLKRLVDFDAEYFLYMYRHRVDWDKGIKDILGELPDDI